MDKIEFLDKGTYVNLEVGEIQLDTTGTLSGQNVVSSMSSDAKLFKSAQHPYTFHAYEGGTFHPMDTVIVKPSHTAFALSKAEPRAAPRT